MTRSCHQCGLELGAAAVGHHCSLADVLEFQTRQARYEIEHELEERIAAWRRDRRISRRLAFASYLREHHMSRSD